MNLPLISNNEKSLNVSLLHQALIALGNTIAQDERDARLAGTTTQKAVRALQAQARITPDDSKLVDAATSAAIADALDKRGLTAASVTFTVSGAVRSTNGQPRRQQALYAFDLDLKGVAAYRRVTSLEDLDKQGGFEFLGQVASDPQGNYSITFHDWQYVRAERKKADFVVYAVSSSKGKSAIIGQSRLVDTSNYFEVGQVTGVDVIVPSTETRTEYAVLTEPLLQFLKDSGVELEDIADATEQVSFTAGELDVDPARVALAAQAQRLAARKDAKLSHELLYGVGRQDISLSPGSLYKRTAGELRDAVAASVEARIISEPTAKDLDAFVAAVLQHAATRVATEPELSVDQTLTAMLANALPGDTERTAFLRALGSFRGSDPRTFWTTHLPAVAEFKQRPQLVTSLLFTQQLTALSRNHQPLVRELQVNRKLTSATQLMTLQREEWKKIVQDAGIPEFVTGADANARADAYVDIIEGTLNAALPTRRIALMLERNELSLENPQVTRAVSTFLTATTTFDFARSRVRDFEPALRQAAGENFAAVRTALERVQRVFQVSTTPKAVAVLLNAGLASAHAIANVPRKTFMKRYGADLGGTDQAYGIHQRAAYIGRRAEMSFMRFKDYVHSPAPAVTIDAQARAQAVAALQRHLPNYSELFGAPDLCECAECRSVYGAAAYFVDLLRFLWRGDTNAADESPLDQLFERRPDLRHLQLTCENTNTVTPYIDLVNEIMEYYAVHDSLVSFQGYDTGEATAAELRANPQNLDLAAYRLLKDQSYPFTLPYHEPLDAIRIYSDRLSVTRHEAMQAVNPQPATVSSRAIAAEALRMSPEQFTMITGQEIAGAASTTPLHRCFGYAAAADLEKLSAVREFLRRSGLTYVELTQLMLTRFINPGQDTLDFVTRLFSYVPTVPNFFQKLSDVAAGALNPASDPAISAALTAANAQGMSITPAQLRTYLVERIAGLRAVITLFQPQSSCDLDTTNLRTIANLQTASTTSGIADASWSKLHRFIRLWRSLGWQIHELDLMLAALDQADIFPPTIEQLERVLALQEAGKVPLDQLAVLWGSIDTYGEESLYRKLFLNRAVRQISTAFNANSFGAFLIDATQMLDAHRPSMLAAFRIRAEDLDEIFTVARVRDGGSLRALNPATDALNIANLSTIYRHVVLARALQMRPKDLCGLIRLFAATPFSTWNVQQKRFEAIDARATWNFFELARSTKQAGFKVATLGYILNGTVPADSRLALDREKALRSARLVREAFSGIEQGNPAIPENPLTLELIVAKLAMTFQPATVARFADILAGVAEFDVVTDRNLPITIPDALSAKYSYARASGRLTSRGIVTDAERTALRALAGVNAGFRTAVDRLYVLPEEFIAQNFDEVFSSLGPAHARLLDHPAQPVPSTLDERLAYVYERFIPVLKRKLRREALRTEVAALIGLSEAATGLLIESDMTALISNLSTAGASATYFADASWTSIAVQRVDAAIDFDWGASAPVTPAPANNFSARWLAYLSAPASGEYTLVVDVQQADEAFNLYLDDTLILTKPAGSAVTSWEATVTLNAARMAALRLEYAEQVGNAGVRLSWKTATRALEIVPATVFYPASILDAFVARATVLHRAAQLISGFGLTEAELAHFLRFPADFDNLDFAAITPQHWKRLRSYTALRAAVPQAQALLTDVFALANATNPAPTLLQLQEKLRQATAWDAAAIAYLVNTHFALGVAAFRNELALVRLYAVIAIMARSGVSVSAALTWGAVETDFDRLHATSGLLLSTLKAKFAADDWLDVSRELSDTLRENRKTALISYLLTRPQIQQWGVVDADGLFEFFLIDVQMSACMDTSRIVQANASVQMFVGRVLLNLESDEVGGVERGLAPGAVDRDRWEWMKNYRVWQANRKIFLYPENWLEPEWRNDRSELFRALEGFLTTNDINDVSAEEAFRGFVTGLADLGNLEVGGLYHENYDDGRAKLLHVFARTRHAPFDVYYRNWNEYGKWSAWQKVTTNVRGVENGAASGVHLIPVVWKKRLFLFWPEFSPVTEKGTGYDETESVEQASRKQLSNFVPRKYWEIRLAWSEYAGGKWTSKRLGGAFLKQYYGDALVPNESCVRWIHEIDSAQTLHITRNIEFDNAWGELGRFSLADSTAAVVATDYKPSRWFENGWTSYAFSFMNYQRTGPLDLAGDRYLSASIAHKVLAEATRRDYRPKLITPFFYHDEQRTYFVRPVRFSVAGLIAEPDLLSPRIPQLVDDTLRRFAIPVPQPDELRPIETILPDTIGGGRPFVGVNPNVVIPRLLTAAGAVGPNALAGTGQPVILMDKIVLSNVGPSFGTSGPLLVRDRNPAFEQVVGNLRTDAGLEFHTFHHPYSGAYVTNLNQRALPGLLESDTTLPSDEGTTFERRYQPAFFQGLVQRPTDFPTRTYYKENVCFDVFGANCRYNYELFLFAPLYVATRLSRNGQHEKAMRWFHYIFDPTTDAAPDPGESVISRYWKVLPFKTTPADSIEDWFRTLGPNSDRSVENALIGEWRDNPFDPHLIAAGRPIAYMKHVVIKYVQNLIAWGDSLFRKDTMESVNESLQLYVMANHLLGPRPENVPRRGTIKAESFASLEPKWDDFSNALVQLENLFPYSSAVPVSDTSDGTNLLGTGEQFYFCIPPNDSLIKLWDTVADRLFKIRHCRNIDGIERKLALFAPPIDPALILQALSQGLSLGSLLADLSSPPPIYRFSYLIAKANEFCADVRALGNALLSAIDRRDSEELARLRVSQEASLLEKARAVKERQLLDARARRESLMKSRETATARVQYYAGLVGRNVAVPEAPTIGATLTEDSALPADTVITPLQPDADVSLVASGEAGVTLIPKEKLEIDELHAARGWQVLAQAMESHAAGAHVIPTSTAEGMPFGVGTSVSWGGTQLGNAFSSAGKILDFIGAFNLHSASMAGRMSTYIRREQDWTYQANLAAREIVQLDKQITSADIQEQIAKKDLEIHQQQIDDALAVRTFLEQKFTNQEMFQWLKEQLQGVYKQSYDLAFEMAKKAEKAFRYELGAENTNFIQYGYWDSAKQGLASGERLQVALRHLEKAHIDDDRREFELTRNLSLMQLDPLALIRLRATGKCTFKVPEELLDLDFRGHYFRRIRAIRLSIPCIAGPYTSVSCTLRLLNNSIRTNTAMNSGGNYEHENDAGAWIDDDRFRTSYVPVAAIATSSAQTDAGMFEFNFGDERYLPFERAGAISEWQLELGNEETLPQFDHSTIADVVLHMFYTAREDTGLFKEKATTYIRGFVTNSLGNPQEPLTRAFSLRNDFPTEWHRFLHPATPASDQAMTFTIGQERLPFFVQRRGVTVEKIEVFAQSYREADYRMTMSFTKTDATTDTSSEVVMPQIASFGGLNRGTLTVDGAAPALEELDIAGPIEIKLRRDGVANYRSLATEPDEIQDAFLVVHYRSKELE